MASGETLLERIRATHAGHSTQDFCRLLEYFGYEHVRDGRHGPIFRHPLLARHPSPDVRMRLAMLQIPRGRALRPYVARKVLSSIDALKALEQEDT